MEREQEREGGRDRGREGGRDLFSGEDAVDDSFADCRCRTREAITHAFVQCFS
jgi:hypothetical protein